VTGRWPSRDPIGERGGLNLYGFVHNNAFLWHDVLGGKPSRPGKGSRSGQKKCEREQAARRRFIASIVGGTEPGNSPKCEVVTVLVKLPDPCSKGLDGKGLGGHTGIGIGDDFYDYGPNGPGSNVFGRPGGPYWDGNQGNDLSDIVDRIDEIARDERTGKKLDVITVEMAACKGKAQSLKGWWGDKYSNPGTYRVTGDQCTSTVCDSLRDNDLYDGGGALKPITFVKMMSKQVHRCGENKERKVKTSHINVGE